jgi:4-diphosphocytidyl-2-C-methyl-D-erythritol kinase
VTQISFDEVAYAKINLALHVRGRRDDGYHEVETLFAFVDQGDLLQMTDGSPDTLRVTGEFADSAGLLEHNLAWRALQLDLARSPLLIELEKRLPVAAGLGGGSADAGAVIRALYRFRGVRRRITRAAIANLGADVPACVASVTCIGRGTGTDLEPALGSLTGTPVLLVNPRIPLATGPVFKAWDGLDRGPMPDAEALEIALAGRNDLEAPAISLCPAIAEVLAALHDTAPMLARMSGSGATCFALYRTEAERAAAAQRLRETHAHWWQLAGKLR